jgi:GNAT superfamily N-acetyltransferase
MLSISTDPEKLDVDLIHSFLKESYWAKAIPRDIVERCIRGALCFGAYDGDRQVGFARVITDRATYAYIADVFVVESHRGQGISKQIMHAIVEHPDLQGLRRWSLATRDAHGLYKQFGFVQPAIPENYMETVRRDIYVSRQNP